MNRRERLRRAAHTLRAAGLTCIVLSTGSGLLEGARAAALPLAPWWQTLAQVMPVPGLGTPIPDSTPTPLPTPLPVAERAAAAAKTEMVRGGPVRVRLTGNLTVGEHGFASTHGGYDSSIDQATQSAGFLVELQRRTASTALTFGVPMGVSAAQRSTIGQMQASYYTSHFGLQYGQQPLSALGGIPLASSLAAFSLVLPLRGGDVTFYQGGGYLDQQNRARLYGVRARKLVGTTLTELGFVQADRTDGLGSTQTLLAGFTNQRGKFDQLFESSLQIGRSPGGATHGSAFQYLMNYGGASTYATLSLKHVSNGFQSLGSGALQGDDQLSVALRTQNVGIQESLDRSVSSTGVTILRQGALSYYRDLGSSAHPISMMWQIGDSRSLSSGNRQWLGSAGVQFSTDIADVSTLFGVQATRSTTSFGPPLASFALQGGVQKALPLGLLAQIDVERSRTISEQSFAQLGKTRVALVRQYGLTSLTLADEFSHTQTPVSNQWQSGPLLGVQRRLSPALAVGASYGLQFTRDPLNPSVDGRTRLFNLEISAPFALGTGLVQGHVNPRLPATIAGTVLNAIGAQTPFAGAVTNGVANVAVILDDTQVQRTDLTGHYQFNVVSPGRHTLQIDLASLPRGVTPDEPIASIVVLGGQEGDVNFQIGTSGAIVGRVMGRDANGALVPLSGVVLTVDKDGGLATTGPNGTYGFGKLAPGTHTVSIAENSLPATVALSKTDLMKHVQVRSGEIATSDFIASGLGSIAGAIVFDPSLAPAHQGGAFNSYVVAEPGDYAAIADQDGSFLMDNLPAGTYTLDVDPETLPPDTGNNAGAQTITVGPDQHVEGVRFIVGRKEKAVVFSFKSSQEPVEQSAQLQRAMLPPGGSTEISVDAGSGVTGVTALAFGSNVALAFDGKRMRWAGIIDVPLGATAGPQTIKVRAQGRSHYASSVVLTVDPKIPVATFSMTPRRPLIGQYAKVRARILAEVRAGDEIRWADGQTTRLGTPLTGRVYEFIVKISVHPLHGLLLTRQGQVPIILP